MAEAVAFLLGRQRRQVVGGLREGHLVVDAVVAVEAHRGRNFRPLGDRHQQFGEHAVVVATGFHRDVAVEAADRVVGLAGLGRGAVAELGQIARLLLELWRV